MLTSEAIQGIYDSLVSDLLTFSPELIVCVGIVFMLFWRVFTPPRSSHLGWTALVVVLAASLPGLRARFGKR